jgi:HD-like signal output (HDOD) protein
VPVAFVEQWRFAQRQKAERAARQGEIELPYELRQTIELTAAPPTTVKSQKQRAAIKELETTIEQKSQDSPKENENSTIETEKASLGRQKSNPYQIKSNKSEKQLVKVKTRSNWRLF